MSILNIIKPTECSCDKCKTMCHGPCWGTVEDIKRIIEAGLESRLQVDWYEGDDDGEDTEVLTPALKGREMEYSLSYPRSLRGCTFWNNGLCDLHASGLKPTEGKLAHHSIIGDKKIHQDIHMAVLETWRTDEGRALVALWKDKYFTGDEERPSSDIFSFFKSK